MSAGKTVGAPTKQDMVNINPQRTEDHVCLHTRSLLIAFLHYIHLKTSHSTLLCVCIYIYISFSATCKIANLPFNPIFHGLSWELVFLNWLCTMLLLLLLLKKLEHT